MSYQQMLALKAEYKKPDLTASDLTGYAIELFRLHKCRVRRVNNIRSGRHKGNVQKGWPDIQGYSETGRIILCEVKKKGDVMTQEQWDRLTDCHECGGLAYVCVDVKGNGELIMFSEWSKTHKPVKKK